MYSVSDPGGEREAGRAVRSVRVPVRLARFVLRAAAPLAGIAGFLLLWSAAAGNIGNPAGSIPGPAEVWRQAFILFAEENFAGLIRNSLVTVLSGFLLAALTAIPLGLAIGFSPMLKSALDPLVHIFKPVSPLAWLPLVAMLAGTAESTNALLFPRSYLVSVITVALCCLWPMLISTGAGIAALNEDRFRCGRPLNAPALVHLRRTALPAAAPMILSGMRQSLGVAWMVLAAVEMLAGNPGLGQFVGEEFRNGGSLSTGRIMTALIAIGLIGCLLDRLMLVSMRRALGTGNLPLPGSRPSPPLPKAEADGQKARRQTPL